MQATSAKQKLKSTETNYFVMIQQAKTGDRLVHEIKAGPKSAIVVASDQQLDD